eukprot:858231-Lingulodinium_polyedra.AAC.1
MGPPGRHGRADHAPARGAAGGLQGRRGGRLRGAGVHALRGDRAAQPLPLQGARDEARAAPRRGRDQA